MLGTNKPGTSNSRAARYGTAIYLLVMGFISAFGEPPPQIPSLLHRLDPYVLQGAYDRQMTKVRNGLLAFLGRVLDGEDIPVETIAALAHMINALLSTYTCQCPSKPKERHRNWRRLANAFVKLIEDYDWGSLGVEKGCQWADELEPMIRGE